MSAAAQLGMTTEFVLNGIVSRSAQNAVAL
jgi:hypothetical protein